MDWNGISVHEFFSGIGGMRLAIPMPVRRCVAYDTSLIANQIYSHNFKDKACAKLVEQLKVEDVDDGSELWTMSPPCQPFTTTLGAHRRDVKDNRTKVSLLTYAPPPCRRPYPLCPLVLAAVATARQNHHAKLCLHSISSVVSFFSRGFAI